MLDYVRVPDFHGYTRFVYFHKYDRVLNMHWDEIMEGAEYSRIPNMPGFCSCESYRWLCEGSQYA